MQHQANYLCLTGFGATFWCLVTENLTFCVWILLACAVHAVQSAWVQTVCFVLHTCARRDWSGTQNQTNCKTSIHVCWEIGVDRLATPLPVWTLQHLGMLSELTFRWRARFWSLWCGWRRRARTARRAPSRRRPASRPTCWRRRHRRRGKDSTTSRTASSGSTWTIPSLHRQVSESGSWYGSLTCFFLPTRPNEGWDEHEWKIEKPSWGRNCMRLCLYDKDVTQIKSFSTGWGRKIGSRRW